MPPQPRSTADAQRWDEGRFRRRLLQGTWKTDLENRLRQHFGVQRASVLGPRSLARNPFRKLCHELAMSYDEQPVAKGEGAVPGLFARDGLLDRIGFWPAMRHVQVSLIGLREMFVRVDWSPELGRTVVRPVTPDVVLAEGHASAPDEPVVVRELRWRTLPGGHGLWAWDVLDVSDPKHPSWRIVEVKTDGTDGEDLTVKVLGSEQSDAAYPYRWTQGERAGQPFLPYSLYHAMRKGCLFDPYEGAEVAEGTLDVATSYTFLLHTIFKASWPQRWAMNAYVLGSVARSTTGGARTSVPTDPASLLHLEQGNGTAPPQIGQWGAGCDVESLLRTVSGLERAIADFDGLDTSHVVRDSSNPWSAAALSITREGRRQAQRRYQPELAPSDLDAIAKQAALWNLSTGDSLPEGGFYLEYKLLPLSRDEAEERRTGDAERMAQGRLSIVDAYQAEHPGLDRDQAIAELERIAEDNVRFGVRPGTAPTPMNAGGPGAKPDEPSVPAAAPTGGDVKVADTALNGAQIDAAANIVNLVATRQLPREAGVAQLIEFFQMDAARAERVMGAVGKSFFIEAAPAAPPPASPAGV